MNSRIWIVVVIGLAVFLGVLLWASIFSGGMMGGWDGWGMMGRGGAGWGLWGLGMGIGMIAFWVLLIGGAVAVVMWIANQGRNSAGGRSMDSALDILRQRYARGEISKEQYEQMRRDIGM